MTAPRVVAAASQSPVRAMPPLDASHIPSAKARGRLSDERMKPRDHTPARCASQRKVDSRPPMPDLLTTKVYAGWQRRTITLLSVAYVAAIALWIGKGREPGAWMAGGAGVVLALVV